MKYEISDLLKERYKYGLSILRIHKKANKGVILFLTLKLVIYDNIIIHILFSIISSMGLLILSNDFIPDYNKYYYLSNTFRFFTPFSITEKLNISHYSYIILCLLIIIICIIRLIYLINFIYKINHFRITDIYNIKMNKFIIILNHIVYILFSYIIEFLSYIYYIELLPTKFIIQKSQKINIKIHRLFFVINGIFILIYNINNYIFISLINKTAANDSYSVKFKFSHSKIYILIIIQNFSLVHPLQCYLRDKTIKFWCIIFNIIPFILLLWLYLISYKLYNYNNIFNSILSFIGEFSFTSIIIEFLLYIFSFNQENYKQLLYIVFIKIIISICIFFGLNKSYGKIMIRKIRKRLFYSNPYSLPFNNNLITSILYLRELIQQKKIKYLEQINEFLIVHKKQCINFNCGCKIISIKNNCIEGDKIYFLDESINKLNYYIESILIHYNFQNNFNLSLLLSEHFFLFKNNPIMSYSILQTLLHYNYNNLNKNEIVIIYELMNKYINYSLNEKIKKINFEKCNQNNSTINEINKEIEIRIYIDLLIKMKKIIKYMIYYSQKFIKIITHKDNYENSMIGKINEINNEISFLFSPYLNQKIISKIILFFSREIILTQSIEKYLYGLKDYNKILTYEFLYKIFLFADLFWNGKIPLKLINIFYSFTLNRNLYTIKINPQIFEILESKYNENFFLIDKKYYLLFKYTQELKIIYISESFIQKLNFNKDDLINKEIDRMLLNELIIPHENSIKQYFILHQNNILKNKLKFIFDNKKYMIKTKMNSTLQIGINKNILIISIFDINEKNNKINFYIDKDLKIISVNKNFKDNIFLSLPLIQEFQIELKDIFGIDLNYLHKKYKKEIKKIKNIREFKTLDTKEYILKNLFKQKNQNYHYHINNKFVINDDNEENFKEIDEKEKINQQNKNNKNLKFFQNIFNNKYYNLFSFHSISFKIEKERFLSNLRKIIFEKINLYEEDKLENKNIYKDYIQLTNNYNELLYNQDLYFIIHIELRLLYDTSFFFCKVKKYILLNISEINNKYQYDSSELKKLISDDNNELNSNNNNTKIKNNEIKENDKKRNTTMIFNSDHYPNDINFFAINNSKFFREKINKKKIKRYKLSSLLLLSILILLVTYIIILNHQINIAHRNDIIFDTLYYNYYQRTQFIHLNSVLLSIFYEILNISNHNAIDDQKEALNFIGNNIKKSHQLFKSYYMHFKIELNENFSKLYEPLLSNKITINWENKVFYNDYDTELALISFRIFDSINHEFNNEDIIDCENLLLGKYLKIEQKLTPVYGNFIKLVYYLYMNYNHILSNFFLNLEDSFDISLNNFSKKITFVYLFLEIIGILSFLIFFFINIFFLVNSNKYIFQNILYLLIDFTQSKDYSFDNKQYNKLAKKKIGSFILLLNEFSPKHLEFFKYNDEENNNILNLKSLFKEETHEDIIIDNKIGKKIKNNNQDIKKNKNSNKKILFKFNSVHQMGNESNAINDINKKKKSNDDIHILNKKELKNLSNSNIDDINISKNNSTNLILNSSINNNNNLINNINNNNNNDFKIFNQDNNIKVTIDKILIITKINMLFSIKILIIILFILTLIFIFYYIFKLIISLLFITNFQNIINDFKILTSQYNNINNYWNDIKTLFILPNFKPGTDLNNSEDYFFNLNNKVLKVYKYRIRKYKRISLLYDKIISSSAKLNMSNVDFCLGRKRCMEIKNSSKFLFSNGIDSTVSLYAKEISNYYKLCLLLKNNIIKKEDIINNYISDTYKVLTSNINHILIYLEEIYFDCFLKDEKDIINNFYLIIKILNIIEICYNVILNLFSIFFIYNFVSRIISTVEVSSTRLNNSILRLKSQN